MFQKKHGMHGTKVYNTWKGIKKRCYQKSYQHFDRYGGRGITMCEEWQEDFLSFYKDMGEPPTPEHQLDRIDNNGNYTKENCRWVTRQENCRNRNFHIGKSGFPGVSPRTNGKYQSYFNIRRDKRVNLGTFDTAEEAHDARIQAIMKHNMENNDNLRVY